MNKTEFEFDTWFETLQAHVLDRAGIDFQDPDSVRDDYERGRDVFDVIDEIVAEYQD